MRLKYIVPLFVLAFLASPVKAEEGEFVLPVVTYPALVEAGASPESFVPQGWVVEHKMVGDLDADGISDAVLVLRDKDPANLVTDAQYGDALFDTNPRMLVVVFGQADGGYRLALENHRLIPRPDNSSQDDVLSESGGVSIERGSLKVTLYLFMSAGGWDMGNTSYTFRHEKGKFRLIGYDTYNVHRGSGDIGEVSINLLNGKVILYNVHRGSGDIGEVSINLLNGKVILKTGHISQDDSKVTARKLKKKPYLTIEDVGDGSGLQFDY